MSVSKFFKIVSLALFIAFALPATSGAMHVASNYVAPVTEVPVDDKSKVFSKIVQRVAEIQQMDKTNLSPAEKRQLRRELREMKSQAADLNRGVYISIGAIIIIILLLILILR